jgi:hypothetical protein
MFPHDHIRTEQDLPIGTAVHTVPNVGTTPHDKPGAGEPDLATAYVVYDGFCRTIDRHLRQLRRSGAAFDIETT